MLSVKLCNTYCGSGSSRPQETRTARRKGGCSLSTFRRKVRWAICNPSYKVWGSDVWSGCDCGVDFIALEVARGENASIWHACCCGHCYSPGTQWMNIFSCFMGLESCDLRCKVGRTEGTRNCGVAAKGAEAVVGITYSAGVKFNWSSFYNERKDDSYEWKNHDYERSKSTMCSFWKIFLW